MPTLVNDVHSRLSATQVDRVLDIKSLADLRRHVNTATATDNVISLGGGRHAMGGQQFGTGTVRLIEKDKKSFLAWARQDYACIIFNLLTPESEAGQQRTVEAFRAL